ncbi:hypothetical protein ABH14_12895 [Brevibacillus brevis]|uniref:ABC transporter permease n=1 Tax=Brevibacillus brevis TaxID=1393 RepID=UPI0018FF658A|nr:ABC transporter permease [Brevibacillus brevis]MBH0330684.1 hypothetical protein [Brevibacillus brevis]
MIKLIMKHRKLIFSVLSLCLLSGLLTIYSNFAGATPNYHGIGVATVDSQKELAPKNQFDILAISGIDGELGATVSQIEVDRVIDGNRVLGFADINKKADRGWYFVDENETNYWIKRFGGNPNYILGGTANVYSKTVSSSTIRDFKEYQAYNLAELASASGGAGYTKGDNLVPDGKGGYVSVGHFRTTPQPNGSITTNKTKYNLNETVEIHANATDFSYYDRGIFVWSLSVINKTTGRGYKSILANQKFNDPSTAVPKVNETSSPPGYKWTFKNTDYKPTEPGLYEVSLTITDLHQRSRQGSSSISVSTPYTAQFTVGDVTPPEKPDPEKPDPGPACTIGSTKTKLNIQVVGDKDIKDHNAVASGGSDIAVEKNADITLSANKPGKYTMNGYDMKPGANGNRKVGTGSIGSSGRVKIVYTSDDGTECWEKYFKVESKDGEDSCPIVTMSASAVRNGQTIEIMPFDTLTFRAKYTTKYGDSSEASLKWDVSLPNGKTYTLPVKENDNGRWGPYDSSSLKLPFGNIYNPYYFPFERGKTYKLKLNLDGTKWGERPECNWEITIVVKDASCSIADQKKVSFLVHSEPPLPFSPEGEGMNGSVSSGFTLKDPVYIKYFTKAGDQYDTNLSFSSKVSGTWYWKSPEGKTALTDKLAADEPFRLMLPASVDVGDEIVLLFESETGCTGEVRFTIESDQKCWDILASVEIDRNNQKWSKDIQRGETIEMAADEIPDKYRFRMFLSDDSHFSMRWFDPASGSWERKRNGKALDSSNTSTNSHWVYFPRDENGLLLEGLYKVQFYSTQSDGCDGHFFVQIGKGVPKPDGENLLIVKSSFQIDPKSPQAAGTDATITFNVKNAGKLTHDTKLAVRWASSEKETRLDVNEFKPGEVRKITVPTKYPQKSEDFIAHINPGKSMPENETIWTDNRAAWPVKIVGGEVPESPGGGGDFDGGEIGLEIYDSDRRQLQKLSLHADGVWEREPATIRVVIDQSKINEGFQKTEQEINQKITQFKAQLESSVSGDTIKNITVTANPGWISDAKSMAVYTPPQLGLKLTGPGSPMQWQVSSASTGSEVVYTGTTVPTQTTWRQVLQSQKYKAEINGFVIVMDYQVDFELSYESCAMNDEDEEVCEPRNLSKTMAGRYTITVKGGERFFEVFEPNATGSIRHTAEWAAYHARDRYPNSQPNDYYAGERILTQVELQDRHRHPVSNRFPVVTAARAWISETGLRQTPLQSLLTLQQASPQLWRGPSYSASKLGAREVGVDTPLMGDKQHGFQKDASYVVYYSVSFRFDVNKGFPYQNKASGQGHEIKDYALPFRIIANAWERQGIRNHTTQ